MEDRKLFWIMIKPEYLDYLKKVDARIPNYNYGEKHFKPFYGVLFEKDDLCYVSQVNHYNPEKHDHIPTSIDFQKIYDFEYNKMISTTNLNYMFPVPKDQFVRLNYHNLGNYIQYDTKKMQYNQVNLLKKILAGLNHTNLSKRAIALREKKIQFPNNKISKRCLSFIDLEKAAKQYKNIDTSLREDMDDHVEQDITNEANNILDNEAIPIKI